MDNQFDNEITDRERWAVVQEAGTSSNGSDKGEGVQRKVERYLLTGTTTSDACIRFCYLHFHHLSLLLSFALFRLLLESKESEGESKERGQKSKGRKPNKNEWIVSSVRKVDTSMSLKRKLISY
jgi:hypothetical protein